jgi:hypothetical protein
LLFLRNDDPIGSVCRRKLKKGIYYPSIDLHYANAKVEIIKPQEIEI